MNQKIYSKWSLNKSKKLSAFFCLKNNFNKKDFMVRTDDALEIINFAINLILKKETHYKNKYKYLG